ncbi:MAG: hypothetical protein WCT52_04620 [Candidatus Micrarchaeia archaeon]
MVALEFNALYATLVVFLSAIVPGVALGWPFLKKTGLSWLEKFLACLFIGVVVPPSFLVIEGMVGLKFTVFLALVNLFLLTAAGVLWGFKTGAFDIKAPKFEFDEVVSFEFAKKHLGSALLLLAVLLAFWIRIQTFTPIYSELDPYFYQYISTQILRDGAVPMTDSTVWWPEEKMNSHRIGYPPMDGYLQAQWYSLYTKGGAYDNYLLFDLSSWLPPLSSMLMSFGAYLLFSSYYGKRYGLLAALLVALLPITIYKMSAGVNEVLGTGFMGLFVMLGAIAAAVRKSDFELAMLAGLGFFAAIISSNYFIVAALAFAGFVALQALDYFVIGKKNEFFVKIVTVLAAWALGATLLYSAYSGMDRTFLGSITTNVGMVVGALALCYAGDWLTGRDFNIKQRVSLLAAIAFIGLVLLAVTPLGGVAKEKLASMVGFVQFGTPLGKTIAEQNLAGSSFESEGGFLALVPKNHISSDAVGALYGVLGVPAAAFTAIANAAMGAVNFTFSKILDTSIATGAKDDSLLFFFIVVGSAGMVIGHFARDKHSKDAASVAFLVLMFILPVSYVGLNKIKYSIFVGVVAAIAAVAAVAELERIVLWIAEKMKLPGARRAVYGVFLIFIVLLSMAQLALPSALAPMILGKSFETRYQDNPAAVMPKLAKLCEGLRQAGYYDSDICTAGYDLNYANSINSQFNAKVCMVSQLSLSELVPKTAKEQEASNWARSGASFRCNRLNDYWVDSMEWISANLGSDDRVTSWWDYGHWINYLGNRNAVMGNVQRSPNMIGRVAHDFLIGSTQDMIDSMNYFDSRYVLFDTEIIGGDTFGGKYGALNYLGCSHEGLTSVDRDPGTSKCEYDHNPERLLIYKVKTPATTCTVSESQQRTGVYAYRVTLQGVDMQKPAYCVGDATLPDGTKITATYYLDRKDANGDLVVSKGFIRVLQDYGDSVHAEMVYNEQKVWQGQNGTLVDGMEDAKTAFYTSNLYRGFYLENLTGYDLVYKSRNGEVKIYKMKDSLFKGNKEGIVDKSAGQAQ